MAIGWRLTTFGVRKGGIEGSPSFLGGFGGRGLLVAVWTPLREVVFGLVGQPMGETAARVSLLGYADTRQMSRR